MMMLFPLMRTELTVAGRNDEGVDEGGRAHNGRWPPGKRDGKPWLRLWDLHS